MEEVTSNAKGTYPVRITGRDGKIIQGNFELQDLGGSCKLLLHYEHTSLSATSSDFFDALSQIRRRLEREGLFPYCYGASRNVYPTDMSRSMAHGLMAPRWENGKKWYDNLVFIFHSGPDVEPVTVAEQREFRQQSLVDQESEGAQERPPLAA